MRAHFVTNSSVGRKHTAECILAGVARFLFASSCSLYGAAGSAAVTEEADLFPGYGSPMTAAEATFASEERAGIGR